MSLRGILHSAFFILPLLSSGPSPGFVGSLWEPCRRIRDALGWLWGRNQLAINTPWGGLGGLRRGPDGMRDFHASEGSWLRRFQPPSDLTQAWRTGCPDSSTGPASSPPAEPTISRKPPCFPTSSPTFSRPARLHRPGWVNGHLHLFPRTARRGGRRGRRYRAEPPLTSFMLAATAELIGHDAVGGGADMRCHVGAGAAVVAVHMHRGVSGVGVAIDVTGA